MWRTLLYQVLSEAPDMHDLLDTVCPYTEYGKDILDCTFSNLATLVTAIILKPKQRRLRCFIDAFDECDEL